MYWETQEFDVCAEECDPVGVFLANVHPIALRSVVLKLRISCGHTSSKDTVF